jgi:hypothetical protein
MWANKKVTNYFSMEVFRIMKKIEKKYASFSSYREQKVKILPHDYFERVDL